MKIAIMAEYPIYPYADELGIDAKAKKRVTTFNLNLVDVLKRQPDVEIHLITNGRPVLSAKKTIYRDNLTITFLAYPRIVNGGTLFHSYRITARRMLKNIQPDIVHGIGTEHIWPYAAVTSSYPAVITVHGIMIEVVKKLSPPLVSLPRYFAFLERLTLRKAKHIISTISPYTENMLYPHTKATFYPVENAIPERFWRASVDVYSGRNILFVGDLEERKSVLDLIQAFQRLRSNDKLQGVKLIIVGPITDSEYCKRVLNYIAANQLQKCVILRGFMLPDELVEEYITAAMLVLPSRQETAPLSISEAMAAGLPVIASRISGIPEMIEDGNSGYLFEVGDIDDLAQKIEKLMYNTKLRVRMGRRGKVIAESRWRAEMVAQKTLEVYRQVISDWHSQ
jgi:glycosyltransferase involved in cell wall biosynthesis